MSPQYKVPSLVKLTQIDSRRIATRGAGSGEWSYYLIGIVSVVQD